MFDTVTDDIRALMRLHSLKIMFLTNYEPIKPHVTNNVVTRIGQTRTVCQYKSGDCPRLLTLCMMILIIQSHVVPSANVASRESLQSSERYLTTSKWQACAAGSDAMNTSNVNGGSNRRVPNCNARHASNTPPWHACPGHQFSPSRNTWKKFEGAQYMLPLRVYPYHENGCLFARIPGISPSDIHMSFDA